MSAAYYSVFHDLTYQAARHLIGSSPDSERNKIRRSWSHVEIASLANMVIEHAKTISANPEAPSTKEIRQWGPLVDIAASDPKLVSALTLTNELQEQRHSADYDHAASFDKVTLVSACDDASRARTLLTEASQQSRDALFTLLAVRRSDFRERTS